MTVPAEPRSRHLELATGLRYHVLEWGAGTGKPIVVLIHGFLDFAWGWAPLCAAGLAERFHVIAPDVRGHGDSDRVGAGGYYYFADYVADLDALLENYGADRFSLVGHSMGGSVASYFAGAFPDRVERLALLEGIGPPESKKSAALRMRAWIGSWRKAREREPKIYPSVEAAAERMRKHDPRLDATLAVELAARGTRETDGGVVFKHDPLHLTMGPYPFRVESAGELWNEITCPVLAVDAADSEFIGVIADPESRYAYFKDLRREILADAGHMMQRHQPKALATLLIDFLG